MAKTNLLTLSKKGVHSLLESWGEPKFRAKQLLYWIWHERVFDFDQMTNMSLKLRARLKEECVVTPPTVVRKEESQDGTVKYLFAMDDLKTVETVWIPRDDQDRVTICVSSQVGCKMGCTFCMTAQQKVERNLLAGEIAVQILMMPLSHRVTNVVLMGMGEPLDNYDAVVESLDLMTDPDLLALGAKRITVSTSGLVPAMKRFVTESKCRLAVSLNAPNDLIRNQIMPVNRAYPMDTLLGTLRQLAHPSVPKAAAKDFRVTFEYLLIQGLNDQPEHARELVHQVRGIPCKINLMLYNENPNIPFKRPAESDVIEFKRILNQAGLLAFVRLSRGRDIAAACGQLVSAHKRPVQLQN
jgi:23S rRNA (adenine2503-C2)-methyltransferase